MNNEHHEAMNKAIERINGMILNQFAEHDKELLDTFKESGDDPVKVSIGVKLSGSMDQIDAQVGFSFHTVKVKGKEIDTVYTRQQGIEFGAETQAVGDDPERPVNKKKA